MKMRNLVASLLTAIGYPLNCALPFQVVVWLLGGVAIALVLWRVIRQPATTWQLWGRRELWRERFGGVIRSDGEFLLQEDVAGIESGVDAHCGVAG